MTNPRDLVQLRALYQSGLLTEDEYTEARRRLLGYKIKRGRPVPPAAAAAPVRPAGAPRSPGSPPAPREAARTGERRSLNSQARKQAAKPRNPDSDLPLLFALAALALVAIAATVWLLLG